MDEDPSRSNVVRNGTNGSPSIEAKITDIARIGIVGLLAYWSLTLIAPFAIILIWAAILAVALFPAYARLGRLLGSRRLASFLITLICLAVIVAPLTAIAVSFAEGLQALLARLADGSLSVPVPPEYIRTWPVVGERIHAVWSMASGNIEALLSKIEPALMQAGTKVLGKVASVGAEVLSFVVSVLIAGFLFGSAERLAEMAQRFAGRIGGQRGIGFLKLATATIRNVARGVIGVALLQAFLCGLVLSLFDVPAPGAIAFVVLILCIIQIGPALVLLPVMIWAWFTMDFGPALLLTILLIPLFVIDNVMKPILVARGLSTPTLVILLGVLGGTLSYGLIGLFLGPIVLSVAHDLLMVWARSDAAPEKAAAPAVRDGELEPGNI
ncbi:MULTISPECIES: AI-2E family transporter [Ensifer]|jgi:predicted PurR-regulated permease PerM|uniref:AI-2E family transporter n=1 Tax=Ensifer adhaerens TaxID=106592 RepID=A0A9Q8Y5L1_ENSAD|nr:MULTISPECIES: AI-2E family transporter [Ensifer]ANK74001.1 AI-2E family transporter [Ensifer adhaerens]KDP76777.1 permease [Ensifer adhaerens]KQX02573.1 permease [Ensifer sp. Root423]KQZ39301.1 permease [Ensifer sp. Root558]MBD9494760.1 AI-2E family transporter [Ensifer sp. ENS01]